MTASASRSCRCASYRSWSPKARTALARKRSPGGGLLREFSAGGVVVRRMRGKRYFAGVRVKGGSVLALPKGHIDPGESAAEAAQREVREETGVSGELIEKLDDIRYWYVRDGRRVLKVVSFFLFDYKGGSVRDHDDEVDSAEWVLLEKGPDVLSYRGERDVARAALTRLEQGR